MKKSEKNNKVSKDIKGLIEKAREYIKSNEPDRALEAFEEVLKENPEAAGAYMGIGNIHFRAGKYSEAENFFNGALHVTKKVAPALAMLAKIFLSLNNVLWRILNLNLRIILILKALKKKVST